MIRLLFTLAYALGVLAVAPAAAQPRPLTPRQAPVTITGAAPGTSIQFFMDANKLADATVGDVGGINWVLDLSNTPKTKVTIYVDVCKDGKIVKVMFVAGTGQAPPKDDDCERRLAALSFQSDCAGVRVNLDFRNFAASRVIGCGITFTDPKVLGTVGGVLVGAITLTAGGGGSTTPSITSTSPPIGSSTTATTPQPNTQQPPTQQPPATQPPASNQPPASQPPATQPPQTNTPSASGNYRCIVCLIKFDGSNHNPTLRGCDGLVALLIVIDSSGTLTIRHPSPFIEVTGTYNATTGAFDLSGTGSIAGFNNVASRVVGTVNLQTGRIVFDWTLGANGVFPGGQPITYSVTIQLQS